MDLSRFITNQSVSSLTDKKILVKDDKQDGSDVSKISSDNLIQSIYTKSETDTIGQKGEKGKKGLPGDVGEKGNSGYFGIRGEQGIRGLKGAKGNSGFIGTAGDEGEIGIKGSRGEVGYVGEHGEKGIKGGDGELGLPGQRGPRGIIGDAGYIGDKGAKGTPGINGMNKIGFTGYTGDTGKNFYGAKGYKGYKGNDSIRRGPRGEIGHSGDNFTFSLTKRSFKKSKNSALYHGRILNFLFSVSGSNSLAITQSDIIISKLKSRRFLVVQLEQENLFTGPYANLYVELDFEPFLIYKYPPVITKSPPIACVKNGEMGVLGLDWICDANGEYHLMFFGTFVQHNETLNIPIKAVYTFTSDHLKNTISGEYQNLRI